MALDLAKAMGDDHRPRNQTPAHHVNYWLSSELQNFEIGGENGHFYFSKRNVTINCHPK